MNIEKLTGANALVAGDSHTIAVDAEYEDGTDIDLTGGNAEAVIADEPGGTVRVTKTSGGGGIVWTNRSAGNFEVNYQAGDTSALLGTYWFEVEVETSGGSVYTVLGGWIEFVESSV